MDRWVLWLPQFTAMREFSGGWTEIVWQTPCMEYTVLSVRKTNVARVYWTEYQRGESCIGRELQRSVGCSLQVLRIVLFRAHLWGSWVWGKNNLKGLQEVVSGVHTGPGSVCSHYDSGEIYNSWGICLSRGEQLGSRLSTALDLPKK